MIFPSRQTRATQIAAALSNFSKTVRPLPGITGQAVLESLTLQLIASLRRLEYTQHLMKRPIDPARANPNSAMFDPERAAIFHARNGDMDEAVWVTFLATQIGKNRRHGWKRLRDVYSALGGNTWTWQRVSGNVAAFRAWLDAHRQHIGGAFGNHRKYESLSGSSSNGTGATVASYVAWIAPPQNHKAKFAQLVKMAGNDPTTIFDRFYADMDVHRFGRLGKFDFLALIGRLGLAPIEPGKAYLAGATGPRKGAKLLFAGNAGAKLSNKTLEQYIAELDTHLKVGKQVMEDALCNWQKSPGKFKHFTG